MNELNSHLVAIHCFHFAIKDGGDERKTMTADTET
jgi:hypothetical protein